MTDDLQRRFAAATGGSELDDLRWLAAQGPRPELRKPRRQQPVGYEVTAELNESRPRIWRTLHVRSDIGLDLLHALLQGAFGWNDSHLHRFAIGGGVFDYESQLFLCAYDVEDGDTEGIPEAEVRLDETLSEPGDELEYIYDYGDHWDVTVRLDKVVQQPGEWARLVAGEGASPPDDCGGRRTAEELSEILDDPARFDLEEANRRLIDPLLLVQQSGVNPGLVKVLQRLRFEKSAQPLIALVLNLRDQQEALTPKALEQFLAPIQCFLEQARGDGMELTPAGYLKMTHVRAALEVVPRGRDWPGAPSSENNTPPVLWFRTALQRLGLLRKRNRRLLLTKAGARGLAEPGFLWGHIASRLIPKEPRLNREASLLTLLWTTGEAGTLSISAVPTALEALGWHRSDNEPMGFWDLVHTVPEIETIVFGLASDTSGESPFVRTTAMRALAREALLWGD